MRTLSIIESQRIRTPKKTRTTHKDHIEDRGHVSMSQNNMAHTPIPIPKAMKIIEAKCALDTECAKLQKLLAWDESQVRRAEL